MKKLFTGRGPALVMALVLAILAGRAALSQAQDWDRLRQAARSMKSVRADFVQEKHLKILSRPIVSKGRLAYQAPDHLRWEYLSPIKSLMLMRGDEVEIYLFSDGQWVSDAGQSMEIRRSVLAEINGWFSGNYDGTSSFTPTYIDGPPARVRLTPKGGMDGFINYIELTLSSIPGVIDTVDIVEGPDTSTRIQFTNVRVNTNIPADLFQGP